MRVRWAVCICVSFTLAGPVAGLDVVAPYVEADFVWDQGYSGDGVEIGVLDLFIADKDHPAIDGNFIGYVNFVRGAMFESEHATEVAGTALSQDVTYKGAAPGAGWWTGQTTNRGTITSLRTQTVAAETFGQGLGDLNGNPVEVVTLSIGMPGDTDGMDQWSLALDHIVSTNGRTVTVAAGNSGPGSGTLDGLPTGAFNVITVGATGDTSGNPSEDYSRLANYSSRGPTIDGRCKPDIVAPGSLVHLPTLDSGWDDVSGTSFATPLVAGGAALLIGLGQDLGYSTDPKVVKSVLLNSANKLDGWATTPSQPLDHNQGAGQMDLERAYSQYLPGQYGPGTVAEIAWDRGQVTWEGENRYAVDVDVAAGMPITVTLTWDRIVTADTENPETAVYTLDHLDNLDLYLYSTDDLVTPVAGSTSLVDNVEHIYYAGTEPGRYVIGVNMTGAGAGDAEIYGLAWHVVPQPGPFGDANLDGLIDSADLAIWQQNYDPLGDNENSFAMGDWNGNGLIDSADLALWQQNYDPIGPLNVAAAHAPEPATLFVMMAAGLPLLLKRKRKSRARFGTSGLKSRGPKGRKNLSALALLLSNGHGYDNI